MSLVLNSNVDALVAQNSLTTSGAQLSSALEQLSSGLRINTAADDAAGYAISNRMTAQINGLNQATRNANDGVSLAQTGSGAITQIVNDLQTMRNLAVQSLNATNSASDRASLDQQFQQLSQDIDTVAKTANFNGVNLLDGSFQGATFQIGANVGQTITVSSVASTRTGNLGQQYTAAVTSGVLAGGTTVNLSALTINGTAVGTNAAASADASVLASAINTAGIAGVSATAAATSVTGATAYAGVNTHTGTITVNGIATGTINASGVQATDVNNAVSAINAISAATGVTAVNSGGNLKLSNTTGANIAVAYTGTLVAGDTTLAAGTTTSTYTVNYAGSAGGQLVIGGTVTNSGLTAATTGAALSGTAISNSNVQTVASANTTLASVDAALSQIATTAAQFGSYQNRFNNIVTGLQVNATNLSAARSRITDTDYAQQTAALTKAQILQQASTAMVSKTLQIPQNVLTLLQHI
jgi:flagellin